MNNFRRRLKMFKKIAGLFLAAAVMCSSAAITASAAEAEDDAAVAAADQSGEVSADGSSEVSADASSEVEAGNVGTLIVKDMSRLGRNYLQVGFYTEILFPQKDVRFLAINNSIDSNNA